MYCLYGKSLSMCIVFMVSPCLCILSLMVSHSLYAMSLWQVILYVHCLCGKLFSMCIVFNGRSLSMCVVFNGKSLSMCVVLNGKSISMCFFLMVSHSLCVYVYCL